MSRTIYSLNEDYFAELTPASAYWLGFIQADGSIRDDGKRKSLRIELSKKDLELLERFKSDIDATHPIHSTAKNCVQINIYSKKIYDDLYALGIRQNKTYLDEFPVIEDPELFRHFIRGVFDGDGSIMFKKGKSNRPRVVILGRQGFCEHTFNRIQDYAGISTGGVYKSSTVYGVTFEGYASVGKLFPWLYKDSNFHLARKFDRFEDYLARRVS